MKNERIQQEQSYSNFIIISFDRIDYIIISIITCSWPDNANELACETGSLVVRN